jgi:hypothetical protein
VSSVLNICLAFLGSQSSVTSTTASSSFSEPVQPQEWVTPTTSSVFYLSLSSSNGVGRGNQRSPERSRWSSGMLAVTDHLSAIPYDLNHLISVTLSMILFLLKMYEDLLCLIYRYSDERTAELSVFVGNTDVFC